LLRKTLLCAAVSGALLVGLEATLRWFPLYNPVPFYVTEPSGPPPTDSWMIADPLIGWRLRPDFQRDEASKYATSNSAGFRGPEELDAPDAPVVVVGDSFVYGTGVSDDDTFAAQLEHLLRGPRVVNLGMPGFGIDQIALTVRHYALPLKPRLIVVGVVELDFERTLVAYNRGRRFVRPPVLLVNGQLVPRTTDVGPLVGWLDSHGRLWRAGRLAVEHIGHYYPVGSWWTVNAEWLADIHAQTQALGVPVLFIHLPTREGTPFPMLTKHFTALNASYLDLGDVPPRSEWYIPGDLHPSAEGHRRIAERIYGWMLHHGEPVKAP
jgi:hypothetical protein